MSLTDRHEAAGANSHENGRNGANGHLPAGGESSPPAASHADRSAGRLKDIPADKAIREQIKAAAERFVQGADREKTFSRDELDAWARELIGQMNLEERFLGFTMVLIGNHFWKRQFLSVPFERRLLLLPHHLEHAPECTGEFGKLEQNDEPCGACLVADYQSRAERLGYKVLVTESSPVVLKSIVSGEVDGILGVASLNLLEKAIDKVVLAGVPSYAIPLHSDDCRTTSLDESWVWDVLEQFEPQSPTSTGSYVPLLRAANLLFEQDLERLLPRIRSHTENGSVSPIAQTETIAYEWLANGGKRFRPFITLAAYDAVTGGAGLAACIGAENAPHFPDGAKIVAMAIEAFHKASLVHDDIEDDDLYRYGRETLHRRYDLGTAINVGDYLIGMGYRLISLARREFGGDVAAEILEQMSAAHMKLCDGQGAEMAWQSAIQKEITPREALHIYALKTSPAFEAALYSGLRMAGPVDDYADMIPTFSRHLGVGFQILNDLKDWRGDNNNKLVAGQDAKSLRPTVLLALALKAADTEQRHELDAVLQGEGSIDSRVDRLRRVFHECGVFETADGLVDKSRAQALALAEGVEPQALRNLLSFLVESVLTEEEPRSPASSGPDALVPLPIAGDSST